MPQPQPQPTAATGAKLTVRLAWFAGLWFSSIAGLGVIAAIIRAVISP
jgi:hypothetical protein